MYNLEMLILNKECTIPHHVYEEDTAVTHSSKYIFYISSPLGENVCFHPTKF